MPPSTPQDRIEALERKAYTQEWLMEQMHETIEKHESADRDRFADLKNAIEQHSVRTLLKENMRWIAVIVVALASGTSGISKLIEILPQLLK